MLASFDYELPPHRVAQRPVSPREAAKLLVVERASGSIYASTFAALDRILTNEHLLLFNQSKVLAARLFGKISGSSVECELLLVTKLSDSRWLCIGKPLRKFSEGARLEFGHGLFAEVLTRSGDYEVEVSFGAGGKDCAALLEQAACMPIPPYIRGGHADERDRTDYQNEFASEPGSIAAPTAGLHFSQALLERLKALGVGLDFLTLHIGKASFLPLMQQGHNLLPPAQEDYLYDPAMLERLKSARHTGRKVIAVGTTTVRAVESAWREQSQHSRLRHTALFIQPGHHFAAVDGIITNFHQPGTTHLLLVEAFLGRDLLAACYDFALNNEFRFLSYGDGMLIL